MRLRSTSSLHLNGLSVTTKLERASSFSRLLTWTIWICRVTVDIRLTTAFHAYAMSQMQTSILSWRLIGRSCHWPFHLAGVRFALFLPLLMLLFQLMLHQSQLLPLRMMCLL